MKSLKVLFALMMCVQANLSYSSPVSSQEIEYNFSKLRYQMENGDFNSAEELKQASADVTRDLIAGGASVKDILNYVEGNFNSASVKADFRALIKVMQKQSLTQEQMLTKVSSFFANIGQQGASYQSGAIVFATGFSVVLVAITVVIIVAARNGRLIVLI